jgi:hypothetical protein
MCVRLCLCVCSCFLVGNFGFLVSNFGFKGVGETRVSGTKRPETGKWEHVGEYAH